MEREHTSPEQSGKVEKPQRKTYDIYVPNNINNEFARGLVEKLDEIEDKDPNDNVRLLIDTYGGSIDAAMEIAERLKSLQNPLITEARSKCYSAGILLLSVGDTRLAHPQSRFLIHHAQLPDLRYSGSLLDLGDTIRPVYQQDRALFQMIAGNIGYDWKQLYRETKTERYFGVHEALEHYHLIHAVIPDGKRTQRYGPRVN